MTPLASPRVSPTTIPGCVELLLRATADQRGTFVKLFQASTLVQIGLENRFVEVFMSTSSRGVIRGLHCQLPPTDGAKLVTCIVGRALDVVVDLRTGSQAFGRAVGIDLSAERANAVYVPRGCAHGFAALTDGCVMAYAVTSEHDPGLDSGVRWDSVDFRWPFGDPVVSVRDAALPSLAEFDSPFRVDVPRG